VRRTRIYIVGRFALTSRMPGMERPIDERGKFFSVWQRTAGGGVRILYDIWNSDPPPRLPGSRQD
jgi:hypothetical protein